MSKQQERWVIKAGSSLVAGKDDGINKSFIKDLVLQVQQLLNEGIQVVIVSSGAVAKGMHELDLIERPDSLNLLQAAAAIGQLGLIEGYKTEFSNFEIKTAQVLISHDDIANRTRYLNARNSLLTLLELGVVPIINENDSVSIEEISFGDNDTLAGAIVGLVDADRCNDPQVLTKMLKGQAIGTFFEGSRDKRQARKTWIASLGSPKGQLIIDDGAAKAINEEGGSLLPVGITALKGEFKKGDLVACQSQNKEVARGFSNFSASELDQIIGLKSDEINTKLGYTSAEEVIHRDNLVLS